MKTRDLELKPRILLTDEMLADFHETIFHGSVPDLCKSTGLSYTLIYNLAHRRINSLRPREYRAVFKKPPPHQTEGKVDGTYFRNMAALWLFLNNDATEANLYRELFIGKQYKEVDYRIFTGQIRKVDIALEKRMERKFIDNGLDADTLTQWTLEHAALEDQRMQAYAAIRPTLRFLYEAMGLHPTHLLRQSFQRYENGQLKSVSRRTYDRILVLEKQARKALAAGQIEIRRLKEKIYGRRKGFHLYVDVEEELAFLKRHSRKTIRYYLGRSKSAYTKGKLHRIAAWRAEKIWHDCGRLVSAKRHLPIGSIPAWYRKRQLTVCGRSLCQD